MPKKRILIDREQFETLKKELIRVSGIDLTLDKAYVTLSEYIKNKASYISLRKSLMMEKSFSNKKQ